MESGEVACVEWTNYALAVRLKAAAMGVPFLPARVDARHRHVPPQRRPRRSPALSPANASSPCRPSTPTWPPSTSMRPTATATAASAAPPSPTSTWPAPPSELIITCERLIPNDEIRRDPSRTVIPFFCVDAVCEVPYGSYPGNMPYEYFSDEEHLRQWLEAERDPDAYRRFLDEYIFGVKRFSRSTCSVRRACRACRSCGGRSSAAVTASERMHLQRDGADDLLRRPRPGGRPHRRRRHRRPLRRRHAGPAHPRAAPRHPLRGRRRRAAAADHAHQRRRLAHLLPRP